MERFVKNFIITSIIYLTVAATIGILMIIMPGLITLRYLHSHFMLLGWVSMMIFGVGYHILPRFSGKFLRSKVLAEAQFYLANIGLIGLGTFYTLQIYNPASNTLKALTILSGLIEIFSIFLFFYNMLATLLARDEG